MTQSFEEPERGGSLRIFLVSWWVIFPGHALTLIELSSVNLHQDPIHFFWLVAMFVCSIGWMLVLLCLAISRYRLGWLQYSKFSLSLVTQILVLLSRNSVR